MNSLQSCSLFMRLLCINPIDRPELTKFGRNRNRNFVNRLILLTKMTTRLIILDCVGYISAFKAVIVFGSEKQILGLKKRFLGL